MRERHSQDNTNSSGPNQSKKWAEFPPSPPRNLVEIRKYGILGKNLKILKSGPKNSVTLPILHNQIFNSTHSILGFEFPTPFNLEPEVHL
jgi:hypothetical protein